MLYILPYKMGSESGRALADKLGVKRIRPNNTTTFIPRDNKWVINWGCSSVPDALVTANFINKPQAVDLAGNKLEAFKRMGIAGVSIPKFTASKEEAAEYFDDRIKEVVCRTKLRGHSGDGIVLASSAEELVDAPLYVQYVPKKTEYRIHIVCNNIIDVSQKARRLDVPDAEVNWKIRNLDGGFIYKREGVVAPDCVLRAALSAFTSLGLDFGAVDVIWNERNNKAFVLEINTAPGITGTTLNNLARNLVHVYYKKSGLRDVRVQDGEVGDIDFIRNEQNPIGPNIIDGFVEEEERPNRKRPAYRPGLIPQTPHVLRFEDVQR